MFTSPPSNGAHNPTQLEFATGSDKAFSFQSPGLLRSDAKFLWVAAACLVLVLIIGGIVFRQLTGQFEALERQRHAVVRSLGIVKGLDDVRERTTIAMRNAADYIRVHDPALRVMYKEAALRIPECFVQLQGVIETDSDDRERLGELQRAVTAQMSYIKEMVAVFDRNEMDNATFTRMMAERAQRIDATINISTPWRQQQIDVLTGGNLLADQQLVMVRNAALKSLAVGVSLILMLAWLLLSYIRRREHSEQQLTLASKLWKGTLESLSQGVAMYDTHGRLMLWNARFCEIHGVACDQLRPGMTLEQVIRCSVALNGIDVDAVVASATKTFQMVAAGQSRLMERQRQDGMRLQISVRPMSGEFFVLTLTDITDIQRSEQTARDQATRLAAIMNNVPDAIVTISECGEIESWNEGAQRLFGYRSEEVQQRNVGMLINAPAGDAQQDFMQAFVENDPSYLLSRRRELEARHKDGRNFPIDLGLSEMQIGERRMFVGIMRDITDRRMVERMKNEFVATVSHELRTPLTSIAGSLGLLTAGAGGELPSKAKRLMDIAHKNSERLTLLINDILDLEKAESGRLELKLRPHSLTAVVVQSMEANRSYAQQFQVRFALRTLSSAPVVLIDEARIMQVLANLLSNAAKFSPHGGQVLITLEVLDAVVRVVVHDDGLGIPESFRDRVFTRFAQADASDSRQKGGTGLGLAIVKSLIEHHRGQVGCESGRSAVGEGQGASFWFELPIVAVEADLAAEQYA